MKSSCAVLYCRLCLVRLYDNFSTLSHKRHYFQKKKKLLKINYVLIFSTTFVWNIFHSTKKWGRYYHKYLHRSSCKVPFILVRFYWNLNSLDRFSKNTLISNSMKISPVWTELFHAGGRTDRNRQTDRQADITTIMVAFRNFTNKP
jgi:hypothetical protein